MRKNKFAFIVVALLVCIMTLNVANAVEIFDDKVTSEVYKVSEDKSDFNLPFTRLSSKNMLIDKSISQVGLFMTSSSIDVTEPLKGVQIYCSEDTVRINSDTEYSMIFCTGNVIINGTIENTMTVFSGGTVIINEEGNIKQNLICISDKVEVNGQIDGNILGVADTLSINGKINGKVRMGLNSIDYTDDSRVEGGLYINTTATNLSINESLGEATIDIIEDTNKTDVKGYFLEVFIAFLSNFVIYLLILILFKKDRLEEMCTKLENGRPVLKNGLLSYLVLIMMIIFGIALLVPLAKLGIVFIILSSAMMIVMTILKNVIFAALAAELVNKKFKDSQVKPNRILTAIMSLLVLEFLGTVPYVGEFVKFVTFIISLGVVISLFRNNNQKINKEETQEIINAD